MREICTSGSTRGSNGIGASLPLLSTLLVKNPCFYHREHRVHRGQNLGIGFAVCPDLRALRVLRGEKRAR